MKRPNLLSERRVMVGGVDAKSHLNVLHGASSVECVQGGRHSRTPSRAVVLAGLAAVLLPLASCAPVYRCVPGSEFLSCKAPGETR